MFKSERTDRKTKEHCSDVILKDISPGNIFLTQQIIDIADILYMSIDVKQTVTLINKKGCDILGLKNEDIIGKNWFDNFIPERIRSKMKIMFNQILTRKIEPLEFFENPILSKNGEERIISWHNTYIYNDSGQLTGAISSGKDISEIKIAENKLK